MYPESVDGSVKTASRFYSKISNRNRSNILSRVSLSFGLPLSAATISGSILSNRSYAESMILDMGASPYRAARRLEFCQPVSLTASVIGNSCGLADRRIAARASRKGLGERDDEAPSDCCDRVGDVRFGSDRQRLWVGNPRAS